MFLRFLISEGKCAVGLDAAIPTPAHWRLALDLSPILRQLTGQSQFHR
jgi:hypothetical protein